MANTTLVAEVASGWPPSAIFRRAATEAVINGLYFGAILLALAWWAPRWLLTVAVVGLAIVAFFDLLAAAAVVVSSPTVISQHPSWKGRLFLFFATIARVAGALLLLWLLYWAWGLQLNELPRARPRDPATTSSGRPTARLPLHADAEHHSVAIRYQRAHIPYLF